MRAATPPTRRRNPPCPVDVDTHALRRALAEADLTLVEASALAGYDESVMSKILGRAAANYYTLDVIAVTVFNTHRAAFVAGEVPL